MVLTFQIHPRVYPVEPIEPPSKVRRKDMAVTNVPVRYWNKFLEH